MSERIISTIVLRRFQRKTEITSMFPPKGPLHRTPTPTCDLTYLNIAHHFEIYSQRTIQRTSGDISGLDYYLVLVIEQIGLGTSIKMIKGRSAFLFVLAAVLAIVVAAVITSKLLWRSKQSYQNGLICHVDRTLIKLSDGGGEESLVCDVLSLEQSEMLLDMNVGIDLPQDFLEENRKALDSGLLYVHIPDGYVNKEYIEGFGVVGNSVYIPPDANLSVIDPPKAASLQRHRRQSRRTVEKNRRLEGTGTRTVLVFRVTTDDASPDIGATEIEARMFSSTQFSFASQFDKCSFGQLTFEPYDEYTPVTELYVPGRVSSFTERTILNAATRRAAETFGNDIWDTVDHAM